MNTAIIEDLNYYNDHRVRALEGRSWFIDCDGERKLVAVKVRTADWHWLNDQGYDPEDFDGGARPEEVGEYVAVERDCRVCGGHGTMLRHKEWKGVTVRMDGSSYDRGWEEYFQRDGAESFEVVPCRETYSARCLGGKETEWQTFDAPRLAKGAEDRLYHPFRVVAFPCKMVDCPTCEGKGHHVNPSIDCGGLTADDFADQDFEEDYFSGVYDVTCYGCRGAKQVPSIDVDAMCQEDLAVYLEWRKWQDEVEAEEAAYHAERMAEIRMGC